MTPKKVVWVARLLVIADIILLGLTLFSRFISWFTPQNPLKSMYVFKEPLSSIFYFIFIASILAVVIAWTMIFCKKKKALYFYGISIFLGYFPTFFLVWAVNGIENFFGTLRLLICGALIYHLLGNDYEAQEEIKLEENKSSDEKLKNANKELKV